MLTTLLLGSMPALAIGIFGPSDSDLSDFAARALMIQDGDSIVVAVQIDPEAAEGVTHWIVPVPGKIEGEPKKLGDDEFESFLAASDPMYFMPLTDYPGCSAGCVSGVADTGELAEVRVFDTDAKANGSSIIIRESADMHVLIGESQDLDIPLGEEGFGMLSNYGAEGWSALLIDLNNGVSWDKSTPLIAYRYNDPQRRMVLPMALTAGIVETELQTLVTVVADGRMDPAETPGVEPRLGLPAYRPEMTRKFYNARLRVAIEEAGGHAWVVEYANTLEALKGRRAQMESVDTEDLIYAGLPEDPSEIFDLLKEKGLLGENFGKDAFVTRWRTYIGADDLRDEPFKVSTSNETYEVFIDAHRSRAPSKGAMAFPLLAMGWLLRRRRE